MDLLSALWDDKWLATELSTPEQYDRNASHISLDSEQQFPAWSIHALHIIDYKY